MNKINLVFLLSFVALSNLFAQEEASNKLTYKFYGFVRTDFCYDSRQSVAANEGLFHLYPKPVEPDAAGNDLNAVSNMGFYAFNTRFGVNIAGLRVFDADVSAQAEGDFAGYANSSTLLRIRRAFMTMKWENAALLIGQEWHPMFGGVTPTVLSLNTGAPFNPFNRSPQINYSYHLDKVTFTGAALWQFQYASAGINGKSMLYQRNANTPEFYLGVDYKYKDLSFGAFADYLTLQLRSQSVTDENTTYKVNERLSSFSFGAYAGYSHNLFTIKAKSILGENLSSATLLGGFGVSKIVDETTGEQEYTNFKHSSSWLNITYGKKYQGGLFAGYTKNLGSQDALVSSTAYGEGMNMNELYRLCGSFSYNIPKFTIGLEYEFTTAVYGESDRNLSDGLFDKTNSVSGHRVLGVICYSF